MVVPRVSVVLATRNRRAVLESCLERFVAQRGVAFEVIVVDNGSTDGTAEAITARFPDVVVVRLADNIGPLALNIGIERARGAYIFRSDDDAYPETETTLAEAAAFLDGHPDVDGLSGEFIDLGRQHRPYYPHAFDPEAVAPDGLPIAAFIGVCALLRRQAVIDAGGFWDRFYYEEQDLATRMLAGGSIFRYVPWIRVVHLAAFDPSAGRSERWLLQIEQISRYQWRYFPFWRALGRTAVAWCFLSMAALRTSVGPSVYLEGCFAMLHAAARARRSERVVLDRPTMLLVLDGRSMAGMMMSHYRARLRARRNKKVR